MDGKIKTGVAGFDELIGDGIEKGSIVLVSGGPGTGKTNFCMQLLHHGANSGEKSLYISFEEPVEQIKRHVSNFGLSFDEHERNGTAKFSKVDVYQIAEALEALFSKLTGGLIIKKGMAKVMPQNFKPDRVIVDSLSAIASVLKPEEYRHFVFQLFTYFKELGATTFAITEGYHDTAESAKVGLEEFLADGVIRLYNIKREDVRVRAIEVLKLRGTKHQERIVPFKITDKGIIVYPNQQLLTF